MLNVVLKTTPFLSAQEAVLNGGVVLFPKDNSIEIETSRGKTEIKFSDLFSPISLQIVFEDYVGRFHFFGFDEWYGRRDFLSFIDAHYAIKSDPICVIYFDKTPEDIVVISYRRAWVDGEVSIHNKPSRTQEAIALFYPEGASILEAKRLAETTLLREFNSRVEVENLWIVISELCKMVGAPQQLAGLAKVNSSKTELNSAVNSGVDRIAKMKAFQQTILIPKTPEK